MTESHIPDQLDRQLVGALQIYPRATWAQLAPILSSSPSTLARRWEAMRRAGVAWSTALPSIGFGRNGQAAFVEARCASGRREESIAALAAIPEIVSIDTCAGEHDLMLTVVTTTIRMVDRIVNERIVVAPGIIRTRTHFASGIVVEGSDFRLGALTPSQERSVSALRPRHRGDASSRPTPAQDRILAELAGDARLSASEIARRTALSGSHVQRVISQLEVEPWFIPRTDISVIDFGFVAVYLWVRCPVEQLDELVGCTRRSAGMRMLVPIVSRTNLLFSVWLAGLDEVSAFQRRLTSAFPGVEIADIWLQTSNRKRVGVLLDEEGRALDAVVDRP